MHHQGADATVCICVQYLRLTSVRIWNWTAKTVWRSTRSRAMHAHVRVHRNEREASLMIDQLCMGYARRSEDHISRADDRSLTRVSQKRKTFIIRRRMCFFLYCVMLLKFVKFEVHLSLKSYKRLEHRNSNNIHYRDTCCLLWLSWQCYRKSQF